MCGSMWEEQQHARSLCLYMHIYMLLVNSCGRSQGTGDGQGALRDSFAHKNEVPQQHLLVYLCAFVAADSLLGSRSTYQTFSAYDKGGT